MLGIGLGVVMEKYYKFDGRSVTGDELVSFGALPDCGGAEGANEVRVSNRQITQFGNGAH